MTRLLLTIICALLLLPLAAQQTPESKPDPQEDRPLQTLSVNVDVVNVLCNVKDKRGALVPGLNKEDFQLSEDGKAQTIKYFSPESDLPLTLGILIDTSVSQERVLGMEQQVGAQFLREVLRQKDLAFVMSFDVNVDLMQDYTASAQELRRALERVRINSGGGMYSGIP